jgi:hypothetical protein
MTYTQKRRWMVDKSQLWGIERRAHDIARLMVPVPDYETDPLTPLPQGRKRPYVIVTDERLIALAEALAART